MNLKTVLGVNAQQTELKEVFGLQERGLQSWSDALLLSLLVSFSAASSAFPGVCSTPTFAASSVLSVGGYPAFTAVGDFNGDAKLDLAVANYGSYDSTSRTYTNSSVSVLLGKGDGTFQTVVNYDAGTNPVFVVVGDFNGDHKLDLAVLNEGPHDANTGFFTNSSISVLLGKGDGTFQAALNSGAGAGASSMAVGDFNGDGKLDLALLAEPGWVLLGKGDGTFQNAVPYDAGALPNYVTVGDFNGDGRPDLVVANGNGPSDEGILLLLGKGDGTFQPTVAYDVGVIPRSVAEGDFNGDGKPDLVAVGTLTGGRGLDLSSNVGTVSVLLGKGDGTFQKTVVNYGVGDGPLSVAVGDFNSDNIPDLVVGSGGWSGRQLTVLLGKGDGTFRPFALNVSGRGPAAIGDFNGDGKPDLAFADDSGNIALSLNAGLSAFPIPTFAPNGRFLLVNSTTSVAVGDFNGDSKPDLAVSGSAGNNLDFGAVWVLLGKGDGTYQTAVYYDPGDFPNSVTVGDFNGDGKADLAVAGFAGVSVLLGKGDGTFQAAINWYGGTPVGAGAAAVGDFNGDGKPDLAVAHSVLGAGGVSVLLGNGNGVDYNLRGSPNSVTVGDFNSDGKADLAVAGSEGVSVLFGNGDGTFQPAVSYDTGGGASSLAVGDFNGDGKPDLAVHTDLGVSVLLGQEDGTFQAVVSYDTGVGRAYFPEASSLAVGDFNGDGMPDLIVVGGSGHAVLLGNGDGTFQSGGNYPGRNVISVAVGDFNGDTQLDWVTISDPYLAGDVVVEWLNTSCSGGPDLAIAHSQSLLTISWPFPSAGYVLETATSLNPPTWKPAGATPVNNHGRLEFTTPTTQGQGYFRLRKP